jgi:hypothetical protein
MNEILIKKAGNVLVKESRSSKEFGLVRLKISSVMAIPNTASVKLSKREASLPR